MTLFVLLAGALLAVSLAVIVRPLLRRPPPAAAPDPALAVFRQRYAEIERDSESGLIDSGQRDALRDELGHELLEFDRRTQAGPAAGRHGAATAAALGVLLPAAAIGLYVYLGEPRLLHDARDAAPAELPPVEVVVAQLAERMAEHPDDPRGWRLLGRSYMSLGRYAEAAAAYRKLNRLQGDDPEVMLGYADALAMSRGGDLSGEPSELIGRALAAAPQHPTALWLAGLAARQRGEHAQALEHWRTLLPLIADEPQARAQLERLIDQATGAPSATADAPAAPALTVEVSLGEALQGEIDGDETLFVSARAVDGPPLPLAVARRRAGELPLAIVLDDRLAMTPAAKLSDHETVDVTARISRAGLAQPQSGDLVGELKHVSVHGEAPLELIIDRRLP